MVLAVPLNTLVANYLKRLQEQRKSALTPDEHHVLYMHQKCATVMKGRGS
jgi:uncharacterized protein with von Willebrand factor type A (vWA) domain